MLTLNCFPIPDPLKAISITLMMPLDLQMNKKNEYPSTDLDPDDNLVNETHTEQSEGNSNARPELLPNPRSTQDDFNSTDNASGPEDEPGKPKYPGTDLDSDNSFVNEIPSLATNFCNNFLKTE